MPTLKVVCRLVGTSKEVQVLDDGTATPGGFTHIGNFAHPDETYPDSTVIYHGVRDLLYKRSAANPANPGVWPNNIVDMQNVAIDNQAAPRLVIHRQPPKFLQVIAGNDIVISVESLGGVAPVSYVWYVDGVEVDNFAYPTSDTNQLTIPNAVSANEGVYTCVVTDDADTEVTSQGCEVTVYTAVTVTGLAHDADPELSVDLSADITLGKDVTFSPVPAGGVLGVLSFDSEPNSAVATATISGNVVNVKPVGIGSTNFIIMDDNSGASAIVYIVVVA